MSRPAPQAQARATAAPRRPPGGGGGGGGRDAIGRRSLDHGRAGSDASWSPARTGSLRGAGGSGRTGPTPEEAVAALEAALKADDPRLPCAPSVWPGSRRPARFGRQGRHHNARQHFWTTGNAYGLEAEGDDRRVLVVGANGSPSPIPTGEGRTGAAFDIVEGVEASPSGHRRERRSPRSAACSPWSMPSVLYSTFATNTPAGSLPPPDSRTVFYLPPRTTPPQPAGGIGGHR